MTGAEVTSLIAAITSPWTLLLAVAVFGFAPVFTVRLAVKLYPANHPRRSELIAELYALRRMTRIFFAAEVVATAVVEGLGERCKASRALPARHKKLRRSVRRDFLRLAGSIATVIVVGMTSPQLLATPSNEWWILATGILLMVISVIGLLSIAARLRHSRRQLAAYKRKHVGGVG